MYTKYTIKKGEHYSSPKVFKLFTGGKFHVEWEFAIDKSLVYNLNNNNQFDWSKLLGISMFKLIPNDKNSIRLGYSYNPTNDNYALTSYYHVDGKWESGQVIMMPNTLTRLFCRISFDNKESVISVHKGNGETVLIERKKWKSGFSFAYENGFYFGGDEAAPNELTFHKRRG